jgi:hypothetical protein
MFLRRLNDWLHSTLAKPHYHRGNAMIARFTTLLPFAFTILSGESLPCSEFEQEEYRIKLYPPCQGRISLSELSRSAE